MEKNIRVLKRKIRRDSFTGPILKLGPIKEGTVLVVYVRDAIHVPLGFCFVARDSKNPLKPAYKIPVTDRQEFKAGDMAIHMGQIEGDHQYWQLHCWMDNDMFDMVDIEAFLLPR